VSGEADELEDSRRRPLRTVFFGGGTPSLVPPRLLARIMAALDQRFGYISLPCTLHSRPHTLSPEA